jgi:hypothetical protein
MDIIVTYVGKIDHMLDELIIDALEGIGCKWLARGIDVKSGERDIVFTLKDKNDRIPSAS